jgi:hypothetical protein
MALYGTFTYGSATYGLSAFPVSADFDIFDFCEPTDATMTALFSFPEVSANRFGAPWSWYNVDNDYCMYSDDEVDSGFRVDIAVPNVNSTLQFSILPTDLPQDFSDTTKARFAALLYNQFNSMIGLLISENAGIALTSDGTSVIEVLPDSADIFDEGLTYYIFRVTIDEGTSRANIYITRKDILALTGVHELKYTISLYDTPDYETDNIRFEVVGHSGESVQVCLDCFRFSSQLLVQNGRPVAVPGDDQTTILGQYTSFDGRSSYDPDGQPLSWWWTTKTIPEGSAARVDGSGTTPSDPTSWTNRLIGSAGDFTSVLVGDAVKYNDDYSHAMYVATDGSYVVTIKDIFPPSASIDYQVLRQLNWGGARLSGSMVTVLSQESTPPGSPSDGDQHLVIATATGDFLGMEGDIALWTANAALPGGGSWSFQTLAAGEVIYSVADFDTYRTTGSGVWYEDEVRPWELDYWEGRTSSVGVYLGGQLGLYAADLEVYDGVRTSLPAEVLATVYETGAQLGLTPDLSFVWNYLSDFWSIVVGKEKFETFWSGASQLLGDEFMQLWQHGYSKSLADIQRTFIRRWLNFDPYYEEPDYDELPATIDNTSNEAGWATDPFPTPIPGETAPDDARSYVLDSMPASVAAGQHLTLAGVVYKIARITGLSLITSDEVPVTDRPQNWMVRPTVTSRTSDFTDLRVSAGDLAIFEVQDSSGGTQEVTCYIWGARQSVLSFDDTALSGYLASSVYTVRFKGVLRRSAMRVDDLVVSIPRLQEVIALNRVDGRPDPFSENNDFRVEEVTTVTEQTANSIEFLEMWRQESLRGFAGYTSGVNHDYFYDASVDFEDTFGAGADLRGYVLEVDGVEYRLYQVLSATSLELFDPSLAFSLSGKSWKIKLLDDPPDNLWAEATYLDNRPTIESNFGRLIGFTLDDLDDRTDNLDYLSAVQGLWYFTWSARTPYNIEVGSQIILGLPFAEKAGTIIDVQSPFDLTRSRILVQDSDTQALVRSYFYPTTLGIADNPVTGLSYVAGDAVERFAPLSKGVTVTDYIDDPEWISTYVGSGDMSEIEKIHTFGIIVNADAFDLVNLLFLVDYLRAKSPEYLNPYFVVLKELDDTIDTEDPMVFGPVPPEGYTYPTLWPAFDIPVTWDDSPWEVARAAVSNDPITGWTTPRPPWLMTDFGNLKLIDSIGRVPDGWSGSWPSGAPGTHSPTVDEGGFHVDAYDESGHPIHQVDDVGTDIALDGDFEDAAAIGAGDWDLVTPGALSYTIAKVGSPVRGGSNSCRVQSDGAGYGIEQEFSDLPSEGFQIAARVWVYIDSGSAHIKLIDNDGSTVVAELRKNVPLREWTRVTVHAWEVGSGISAPKLQIVTGSAGGDFYVDDVEIYHTAVPWGQWGFDRAIRGRTGGYTFGGSPDEHWEFKMYVEVP